MKKSLISYKNIIIIMLICLNIISFYSYEKEKNKLYELNINYDNSILLVTENKDKEVNYIELNDKGNFRKISEFIPDKFNIIHVAIDKCYDSYGKINGIYNEFLGNTCYITNDDNEMIDMTDVIKEIIIKASEFEHVIVDNKIFELNDEYYVYIEYNVNLIDLRIFYYYNKEKHELKELYSFDGIDVVGIKEKKCENKRFYID